MILNKQHDTVHQIRIITLNAKHTRSKSLKIWIFPYQAGGWARHNFVMLRQATAGQRMLYSVQYSSKRICLPLGVKGSFNSVFIAVMGQAIIFSRQCQIVRTVVASRLKCSLYSKDILARESKSAIQTFIEWKNKTMFAFWLLKQDVKQLHACC